MSGWVWGARYLQYELYADSYSASTTRSVSVPDIWVEHSTDEWFAEKESIP